MGLSQFRPSALVATTVTLLTVAGLIAGPELSTREHESFIRTARGTVQRLGTGDTHDHEGGEPGITSRDDRAAASSDLLSVHAPPGPPAVLARAARIFGPAPHIVLPVSPFARLSILLRPHRPALGRAPPSA